MRAYGDIRSGVSDWRRCRSSFDDRHRGGELAARLGWLHLENTWLAFLGFAATPYIWSVLAIAELIADKLLKTPSRKTPGPFAARIVLGALCGAALGATSQAPMGGLVIFRSPLSRTQSRSGVQF